MAVPAVKRYAVRRTLYVPPVEYGSLRGTDYGSFDSLEVAIRQAKSRTALGYPSRVVDTHEGVAVWERS